MNKRSALLAALGMALALQAQAYPPAAMPETGFLVIAADRGFQGNEEIRDAFDALVRTRNSTLAVVTDERTRETFTEALGRLREHGARRVVVLPAFIGAADTRLALARGLLAELAGDTPVAFGQAFGESYFAVEALSDRFRALREPKARRVIVAGYGTADDASQKDLQRIAEQAAEGFGVSDVRSVLWRSGRSRGMQAQREEFARALAAAAAGGERVAVVPFHLGRKLDSMMSFDADLRRLLPAGAELVGGESVSAPLLSAWMLREANRHLPLAASDIGVVVLAHGSDYHWNETLRRAAAPLEKRYKVEYSFNMADQALVERAVRRLEARGARAGIIVRVFGRTSAFRADLERMIGADLERPSPHAGHSMHGHGQDARAAPPPRIRTALPLVTVGGVEADPFFGDALLDRARELSRAPESETVILVAHGSGSDAENERWLKSLEGLAAHMSANGGAHFRAIKVATWREDWPEKRAEWIERVRGIVSEASERGRALVIPARVNGSGPEREYLKGLQFELGSGFAPHPLFARWAEKQVESGIALLGHSLAPRETGARAHERHAH